MKKLILILIFFSFGIESFACECHKILWAKWNKNDVKKTIKSADVIFIGKLVSSTEDYYQFKVFETFKGTIKNGEIIEGYYPTSCSGRPYHKLKGFWVFYGYYEKMDDEKILNYSSCGPTRSLNYPIKFTKKQNESYWEQELELLNTEFRRNVKLELNKK